MHSKFKFDNPFLFWIIIVIMVFLLTLANEWIVSTYTSKVYKKESSIAEQSYKAGTKNKQYIVDIDNLHNVDFELTASLYETSFKKTSFFLLDIYKIFMKDGIKATLFFIQKEVIPNSGLTLLLYVYTVILSTLFVYREKRNRKKLIYLGQKEDNLQIQLAQQQNRTYSIDTVKELENHQDILGNDLQINTFQQLLDIDPEALIIKSRKITEKIVSKLYDAFTDDDSWLSLDEKIKTLHRKKVLNDKMRHYANTTRAFGNKAVHHDSNNQSTFSKNDALLTINSLLLLIEEIKSSPLKKDHNA